MSHNMDTDTTFTVEGTNPMDYHTELIFTQFDNGESWFRVTLWSGNRQAWKSRQLRNHADGSAFARELAAALFRATCQHGDPIAIIDHFGNLDRDPTDIIGYCEEACKREADREATYLERTEL